jgi:hypothetical protein
MRVSALFLFCALCIARPAGAQSFRLSSVSDLVQVFEDGYHLPAMGDTIKASGMRGEIVSAQCVIHATNDLTGATVSIGALRNAKTGASFSGSIRWNFVGDIALAKNTPNQEKRSLARIAPARFPDYLMEEKQIDIKGDLYESVWLTIDIPENAAAGQYDGTVTVKGRQGERSIPFTITVYPLTMPRDRHLKITEWYNTNSFERFHGIREKYSNAWFAMLAKYAQNMVEHRQNVFQVPSASVAITRGKNGNLTFDFTRFDQIANVFWNTKKMDYLETGELAKFKDDWFSSEILLKDFKVQDAGTGATVTLAGKDVVPYFLPALEDHLREKGWLDKTLFHIKDEPSLHNAAAWREMSSYVHRYAPHLRRIDAIETTFLLDDIEVGVPKLDALASWYASYKKAQEKGMELWFYTVGIYQGSLYPDKTIDMPLIDSRIMHWMNYRFDATGYLHWGWNQWTEDPYNAVGEHIGDGWHVYPVKDGVVNSLRWEEMRNGIQDYEYLWLLENKTRMLRDSLGEHFRWIDPSSRGKEIASRVVKGFTEYTSKPQVLYDARRDVVRELVDFDRSPRVYVETNPPEFSTLTRGSSVEVFGWAEKGAKVVANGKSLPVDDHGFFGERFSMSDDASTITLRVTGSRGSKEITRAFVVE